MKLVAFILVIITLALCLVSCGNKNLGFGNYDYTHACIGLGAESYCVNVDSWHNNEIGVELHLTGGNSIYCAEGTYILIEDASRCPFCHN